MSDIPFSVKHRPKKLSDVIGQDVVVQSISNAFKHKTLHHAYIFAGKYGCGKTTACRILAAMENCDNLKDQDPCGECNNCKQIFSGKSLDVKEIDAASNRSIDDIRALKDEIKHNAIDCKVKYVIIDEAHSLTGQAAEAALKMIEEPPKHVRFILATTDPHKLKDTIHSRCITLKFHSVNWALLTKHLINIANLEGIKCEPDALKIAARTADGSVRNSLQNLQTLVNYAGEKEITADYAKKILGTIDDSVLYGLMNAIVEAKAPVAIKYIETLLQDGKTASEVVDNVLNHLRGLMLAITCRENLPELGFVEEDIKRMTHQASTMKLSLILEMIQSLSGVSRGITFNLDPQTLLEKYVIDSIIFFKQKQNPNNNG